MASGLARAERFIANAGFARAPWLTVAYACGIAAWFAFGRSAHWISLIAGSLAVAAASAAVFRETGRFPHMRQALVAIALALAAGCATVWIKSELVGSAGISRPFAGRVTGIVLARQEQPAEGRTRLVLAIRNPEDGQRVARVRVNVPARLDDPGAREGARVEMKVRLMPPAPPLLPGGYDFARAAWFSGLVATGTAFSAPRILDPGPADSAGFRALQRTLSAHVRGSLTGSPGGVAAAFASGDRGGIAEADEEAMRDSGLTHLLSVSGLHVSAVMGGVYFLALRLLGLWPWLALRVRLPLLAAGSAAGAGVFYTLLTGGEVPTVRSVVGALLVLTAVALGREALSLRLLAVTAFLVLLVWPDALVGASFQLSFAAVLAIVALHGARPMRAFVARRDEPWWALAGRRVTLLFVTGVVIELTLLPIVLFHFNRAGIYGSLANVVAIPLTTFLTMPLIALALILDLVGAGAPAWWLVGRTIDVLLGLAHFVATQPGATLMVPDMNVWAYALFISGGLWLALWTGHIRLYGLGPVAVGVAWLMMAQPADVLVSRDGRHVAFPRLVPDRLLVLRPTSSRFALDNLAETAGMDGEVVPLATWPGARCNPDFCALEITQNQQTWRFLLARGADRVPLAALAAACAEADVVVADRWLPRSCQPRMLKADRRLLDKTGGLALHLASGKVERVADGQGEHGWWRAGPEQKRFAASPPRGEAVGVKPRPPLSPNQ